MKLVICSKTSTVQPLKFGNGWVIPAETLLGMWLLIHAGIKVKPCLQKRPQYTLCVPKTYSIAVIKWSRGKITTILQKNVPKLILIFLHTNHCVLVQMELKYVTRGSLKVGSDNGLASSRNLDQYRSSLLSHICVNRPQFASVSITV